MMQIGTLFAIYLAPLLLAATYYIRRITRRQAEAERLPLPFNPKPIAAPTGIFRNLTAPQRVYLAQQFKLAFGIYLVLAWTEFFILSMQFLTSIGSGTQWFNPAARTWFLFLSNAAGSETFFSVLLIFCAYSVIIPIRMPLAALFHRTRPLSMGFLFWTRVTTILFALCAAMFTGILLAFALLAALKGPVWHNLPTTIPRAIGPDDADIVQNYAALLITSAPRIFLSIITTMAMFFSILVAIFTVPFKRLTVRSPSAVTLLMPVLIIAFTGPLVFFAFDHTQLFDLPRIFFVYTHLGPPPTYLFALGPIVISAALLLLARVFVRRIEL